MAPSVFSRACTHPCWWTIWWHGEFYRVCNFHWYLERSWSL